MSFPRFAATSLVLSMILVGCSQAPQKEIPKITPAEKADLDKQHGEMKAKMESETKPAGGAMK